MRGSTLRAYTGKLQQHVIPAIGRIELEKLGPTDVHRMLRDRIESGLSARTVAELRGILRAALNDAIKWGYVARNAAALANPPKVERYRPTVLTAEQARRFLELASHDRLSAFYTVALALGLREGEALALRWEDVDLDGGTLAVTHTLQRVKGKGLQALDTKTERSHRTLRMPDVVVRALREHRLRQIQERLIGGSRWRETGYVFTTTVGTPVPDSNLGRSFHRIRERLGLPRLRIHDLRHSCATLLLAQGVSARTVMDTLGHTAISTTLDIYGHVTDAMQAEAARAMDRALGS